MLKGIAIVAVVAHHVSSFSLDRLSYPGTPEWWVLQIGNHLVRFAVPTFLLISALLVARSLARSASPNWKSFYAKRAMGTLYPLVIWAFIYIFGRAYFVPGVMALPTVPFGSIRIPEVFTDWKKLTEYVLLGKAIFHLYFLAVLVQIQLLFPVLFLAVRNSKRRLLWWVLWALFFQTLVYLAFYFVANYFLKVLASESPLPPSGSMFYSYLIPVVVGAWIGTNWETWVSQKLRYTRALLLGAAATLLLYVVVGVMMANKNLLLWRLVIPMLMISSTLVALWLLHICEEWKKEGKFKQALVRIGNRSLGIFLIHPILLFACRAISVTKFLNVIHLAPVFVFVLVFLVSWCIVELIYFVRCEKFFFGR